jgi:hypothetical protein
MGWRAVRRQFWRALGPARRIGQGAAVPTKLRFLGGRQSANSPSSQLLAPQGYRPYLLKENPACTAVSLKSFPSFVALIIASLSWKARLPSGLRVQELLLSLR